MYFPSFSVLLAVIAVLRLRCFRWLVIQTDQVMMQEKKGCQLVILKTSEAVYLV